MKMTQMRSKKSVPSLEFPASNEEKKQQPQQKKVCANELNYTNSFGLFIQRVGMQTLCHISSVFFLVGCGVGSLSMRCDHSIMNEADSQKLSFCENVFLFGCSCWAKLQMIIEFFSAFRSIDNEIIKIIWITLR